MCLHKRCEFIGRSGEFFIKHKEKTQTNQHNWKQIHTNFLHSINTNKGSERGKKKVKNSNNQSK